MYCFGDVNSPDSIFAFGMCKYHVFAFPFCSRSLYVDGEIKDADNLDFYFLAVAT